MASSVPSVPMSHHGACGHGSSDGSATGTPPSGAVSVSRWSQTRRVGRARVLQRLQRRPDVRRLATSARARRAPARTRSRRPAVLYGASAAFTAAGSPSLNSTSNRRCSSTRAVDQMYASARSIIISRHGTHPGAPRLERIGRARPRHPRREATSSAGVRPESRRHSRVRCAWSAVARARDAALAPSSPPSRGARNALEPQHPRQASSARSRPRRRTAAAAGAR